ncbi:MAG: TrmH family RNA methyltransferase [Pirellulales bacterium]
MNTVESITSPTNPRVKRAAALRDADDRRSTGLTLVDGRRELARAEAAAAPIVELFVAQAAADRPGNAATEPTLAAWIERLAAGGTRIAALAPRAFEKVAFGGRNEGVVGVVRFGPRPLDAVAFPAERPVVVVEGVEKPGNLGAIVRTVDAAGLGGVVVCDGRTDVANPAAIRASLGTIFSVPIAVTTTAEAIAWCGSSGRRVVAATPGADRHWHAADLRGGVAILLGSEAHGIGSAWTRAAASGGLQLETVSLPMHGLADSLNLSVTAAVLAYESVRQREAGR